jgi:hypothetical protein
MLSFVEQQIYSIPGMVYDVTASVRTDGQAYSCFDSEFGKTWDFDCIDILHSSSVAGNLARKFFVPKTAKSQKPQNISKIMRVVGCDVTIKLSNIYIKSNKI